MLEPEFYEQNYEKYIKGLDMEPYKTFFVPFGTVKNRESSSDKGVKAKEKVVTPICGKITLPKEYIKTKKVTNEPNLITRSEATSPELILVDKLRSDLSVNSRLTGETRASVTPEKRIPRKKRNIKSLATSPPIKDPNPN